MKSVVQVEGVTLSQLERLFEECLENGIGERAYPKRMSHTVPFVPENPAEQCRLYMLESLYTGLSTDKPDIMMRAYVQAHGYIAALGAYGKFQGAYYQDLLRSLRGRVEAHFLRGE